MLWRVLQSEREVLKLARQETVDDEDNIRSACTLRRVRRSVGRLLLARVGAAAASGIPNVMNGERESRVQFGRAQYESVSADEQVDVIRILTDRFGCVVL